MTIESPTTIPNYLADLRLKNKGFIVFGAGPGIGDQTCHALSQAGAKVLCVDIDAKLAKATAKQINGHAMQADVTQRSEMKKIFAKADKLFGKTFYGLVDVVGIANIGAIPSFDDDALTRQFDLVYRHAFMAVQIGAPMLAKNGGGVLTFIGSISGLATLPNHTIYGSAKAALHQMVRYAAQEFGPCGIRVNAIAPGYTRTPRILAHRTPEMWQAIDDSNPLRRGGNPQDVARVALFLSSNLAKYVTGNILTLDGGVSNATSIPRLGMPVKK
ncbi:MAG: SDR family NAD(P)-dependent oxidoreductase [Burkholderiales bacterium]